MSNLSKVFENFLNPKKLSHNKRTPNNGLLIRGPKTKLKFASRGSFLWLLPFIILCPYKIEKRKILIVLEKVF